MMFTPLLVGILVTGCTADKPLNPSFPLTSAEARVAWQDMRRQPRPLARPVVVLGGIFDPGVGAREVAEQLRAVAQPHDQIISVTFTGAYTFDDCAARVIESVERAWPCTDADHTVEVDVVACSMGGLVARHAARNDADGSAIKRLRIARLFTISTPHRGAKSSFNHPTDRRIADMRPDSDFIQRLNEAQCDYPLHCYVLLNDGVVGEANAAPPGCEPWWLPNSPLTSSHMRANNDARILADIARRLRDEPPFARHPPAPLPLRSHGTKSRISTM